MHFRMSLRVPEVSRKGLRLFQGDSGGSGGFQWAIPMRGSKEASEEYLGNLTKMFQGFQELSECFRSVPRSFRSVSEISEILRGISDDIRGIQREFQRSQGQFQVVSESFR